MLTRRSLVWEMAGLMLGLSFVYEAAPALAQDWTPGVNSVVRLAQSEPRPSGYYRYDRANPDGSYSERAPDTDRGPPQGGTRGDAYHPPRADAWRAPPADNSRHEPSQDDRYASQNQVGRPYSEPNGSYDRGSDRGYDRGYGRERADYDPGPRRRYDYDDGTFSPDEIRDAGHSFFGSVSKGLANVIEYAFQKQGRPNGYILGEEVGGAFVAGLRYGEGWMYTRDAGRHKVFWQGPSIGYDAGAEGSKVMVLVYNLRDPYDIYHRFGGVEGSAYVVGGAGVTFQTWGDVVLAPIRSGIGLRFGASVGYLKYTRTPTWNPF
jgi:hypothetical protein